MDDTMTSLTRGVGTFLYRAPEVAAARPGQHYAGQETKLFDTTSICMFLHDFDIVLSLSQKNPPRENDPSKNQPKRLRCDRAREV